MVEAEEIVVLGVLTLIVVVLTTFILLGIRGLIYYFRRRKLRESASEEEIISTAVGGGNSEEVTTRNEINRDRKTLDWTDERTIKALVSVLPRELKVPKNTCLKKLTKKEKKILYSCVVDTVIAVNEAILLNQGGTQFYENRNSKAREVIDVVKKVLAWRLRNEYQFTARERNKVWEILLKQFPKAFKPKGTNKASIKPVMDALVQGQPIEVIFTANCLDPACKEVIGTYKYKFNEAPPCAKSVGHIRGRIPSLNEKLTEIIHKSLKQNLKQITMRDAKKIRCLKCKTFGATISPIESSDLKIPNVLILEFVRGEGYQEMYPMELSEEISLNDEKNFKLVSVVMHKTDHFFSISRIGKYWYNFDNLQEGPAQPFESFLSAFTLKNHEKEKRFQFNNRKETRGNVILYVVYTSDNGFIGDYFQENIESPSFRSTVSDEDLLDEIEEVNEVQYLSSSIASQVVDNNDNGDTSDVRISIRSTPKKRMMDRYKDTTPKKRILDRYCDEISDSENHWTPLSDESEPEFVSTTAMVHQPNHFESAAEEVGNPTNHACTVDWRTEGDQTGLENEIRAASPEHYSADVEAAGEAEAENSGEDIEEEFRIVVDGQNILKSIGAHRFKCLCPCLPTVTSKNYNKCYQHLYKTHQMRIIIPVERCTLCKVQNKSVFKNIHTCAVPPRPRKNMKWRNSARYLQY